MINILCATNSESRPIIDFYKLKKSSFHQKFNVYQNNIFTLIITKIGKKNAAAATAYLHNITKSQSTHWFNIGIAGSASLGIGEIILANKISDASLTNNWTTIIPKNYSGTIMHIQTLNKPCDQYLENIAFDMEASAIYQTAMAFTQISHIHCIKIISDNRQHSVDRVKPETAQRLIKKQIQNIDHIITQIAFKK